MKTIFCLVFKNQKGLRLLADKYEDDLYRISLGVFAVFGIVNFFKNKGEGLFHNNLYGLLIAVLISLFFGMLCSFVLYKIGRVLKGKGEYADICPLYAYAIIPIVMANIFKLMLEQVYTNGLLSLGYFRLLTIVNSIVFSLISLKILFFGLKKFNRYSYLKSAINIIVFSLPIIGLYFYLLLA
ncbi:Yip1 domain-containing protein [Tenacibaculum sp. 190524A02b]|uniref:YIP1 family protein n=1 Tax=Tenacibaculum vairaonense TaxID=3137860 RepID=UPI0032B22398